MGASPPEGLVGDELAGDDGMGPPRWLLLSALVTGGGVLTFGWVGLLLAVNGRYNPALAFPVAAVALVGLVALVAPELSGPRFTARAAQVTALVGVAAIVAITAWNGVNASQHVLTNRDGGVYSEIGRWIARSGSLAVPSGIGPFRTSSSTYVFPFAHLLPALLAQAFSIGGSNGLYHLPPVLGGIALLEFLVLAWRILRRPGFALAATLTLGLIIPEVSFGRDSYSEIPTQILVFAALGLLIDRRGLPHWRRALAAGLFLGTTQAARIDATVLFVGIPPLITVAWLRVGAGLQRRALIAPIVAFVVGLLPGCALGLVDLVNHSGSYWNGLWHDERVLLYLTAASTVGCAIVVSLWRYLLPLARSMPWNSISWVAAGLVLVAAFGAWFLRPVLQVNHGMALTAFDVHGHRVLRITRLDYERSMTWMSWYLGPTTLTAAIIGAACLARSLLRGRMMHVVALAFVLVPGSLMYLWKASAFTDHVWVTRRFLDNAFPLLILLAFGLATYLWTARPAPRWARPARFVAIGIAVTAVAFPVYALIPISSMRDQAGYQSVIDDACRIVGDHSAVLLLVQFPLIPTSELEAWVNPALQVWCGADTAFGLWPRTKGSGIRQLATEWKARGRNFFVVALSAGAILDLVPDARIIPTRRVTNAKLLDETVGHRPDGYQIQSFSLAVGVIPVP